MDTDLLARWFNVFAEVECSHLPLYRALSTGIAEHPAMLGLLARAAPGQWRPVLLFAALHDLVLRHPDEDFARFYPTVGGRFAVGTDPMPALADFVEAHAAELEHLITTRSTQTNEVNRSCLWFATVRHVVADLPDRPVALVEVGASAGLNLVFDRYRYDFGDGVARGDAGSPVRLRCDLGPVRPPLDVELPQIVSRTGIDLAPVDLDDAEQRRWLKACIWPEQPMRHARFDAAVQLALLDPPTLVADDAVDGIADVIESCPGDAHIVIINSWALTYLKRERRAAFTSIVDMAGATRDISWISAEGDGVVEWVPRSGQEDVSSGATVVAEARWRNGRRTDERVADCHPHLEWMNWG